MNEIAKELLQALKTATEFMWHGPGAQGAMEYANETIAKAEAAMAKPQPDADEWIEWSGGECPVSGDTWVGVRCRNRAGALGKADGFDWYHYPEDSGYDIIAYRIVKEPA